MSSMADITEFKMDNGVYVGIERLENGNIVFAAAKGDQPICSGKIAAGQTQIAIDALNAITAALEDK